MGKRIGKYMVDERTNTIFKHDVASGTFTNLDLGGTLDVSGASTLDSTLTVAGAATLSSTLAANGHITIADAKNIVVNTSTGTKIGTATGQKIAFHNATPVVQASHIADIANDATGTQIATAVNAILAVLEGKGFTATS